MSFQEESGSNGLIEAKRKPMGVIEDGRDRNLPKSDELVIGRVGKIPLQVGRRGTKA
jgi:hypothetical protein